jgi:hypothetical protein
VNNCIVVCDIDGTLCDNLFINGPEANNLPAYPEQFRTAEFHEQLLCVNLYPSAIQFLSMLSEIRTCYFYFPTGRTRNLYETETEYLVQQLGLPNQHICYYPDVAPFDRSYYVQWKLDTLTAIVKAHLLRPGRIITFEDGLDIYDSFRFMYPNAQHALIAEGNKSWENIKRNFFLAYFLVH